MATNNPFMGQTIGRRRCFDFWYSGPVSLTLETAPAI